MLYHRLSSVVLVVVALHVVIACGSDSGKASPPPGSCTGGPATGSFAAACGPCGQQKCDAELRDKAGSGYAQHYWGGDGACAGFNGCMCECQRLGMDPLQCATSATCLPELTTACQAAVQKANDCIEQNCATECR
jgi:hypothetical protein